MIVIDMVELGAALRILWSSIDSLIIENSVALEGWVGWVLARHLVDLGTVGIVIFLHVFGLCIIMVWSSLAKFWITLSVKISKGCPKMMSYAGN
jgi:hypothetical protein